jgi:hypothetical protein
MGDRRKIASGATTAGLESLHGAFRLLIPSSPDLPPRACMHACTHVRYDTRGLRPEALQQRKGAHSTHPLATARTPQPAALDVPLLLLHAGSCKRPSMHRYLGQKLSDPACPNNHTTIDRWRFGSPPASRKPIEYACSGRQAHWHPVRSAGC